MFNRVVLAFDGSQSAQHALERAKRMLAKSEDTAMHVISVSNNTTMDSPTGLRPFGVTSEYAAIEPQVLQRIRQQEMDEETRKLKEQLEPIVGDMSNEVVIESVLQTVSIADTIIDYATDHDCDLIILGNRGLGAIRGVLGSVSYAVLRAAPMPVLIVK